MDRNQHGEEDREIFQMVTFRLGGGSYAMPVMHLREIIKPVDIYPVPGMSEPIIGVINLRGEIIPVMEIAALMKANTPGKENNKKERIIIVDSDEGGTGLMVDEVMEVIKIKGEDVKPPPDLAGEGFIREVVRGVTDIAGSMVVCIEPMALIINCMEGGELLLREKV